ncbi:MAG: glycosyltransferase [Desulfobacterales bacterium]|nr:glycosyltransferase [Desulfobacterales bacterium]
MKVLFYCQHVWGMGHVVRIVEIARALENHDVLLVTGGPAVDIQLPANVRRIQLPALRMLADKQLVADDGRRPDAVWADRIARLHALFREERPEVFVVELYPFGRTAFGRELDPLLAGIRSGDLPRGRIFCSLRDILVAKRDPQAYEARVARRLNRWFDALLIHADPDLIPLDATFSSLAAVEIPVVYTGYVTRPLNTRPEDAAALRAAQGLTADDKLIVVSAGGGRSGYPLMAAVQAAVKRLRERPNVRLAMFTGPYLPEADQKALAAGGSEGLMIQRFTHDLGRWLSAADLSVSMAGYNTCMDIIVSGVPSLVWPFGGDREQPLRSERLAAAGWVSVLGAGDLEPSRLAGHIREALEKNYPTVRTPFDLTGAARTARYIEAQARSARVPGEGDG